MDLNIEQDDRARGGYAWMEFDGASDAEQAVFCRGTRDNPYLGPDGRWQGMRHAFTLQGGFTPGGLRGLRLPPDIVDVIEPDSEISVLLSDRGVTLTGWWPHLPPSGRSKSRGVSVGPGPKGKTQTIVNREQEAELPSPPPPSPPPSSSFLLSTKQRRWRWSRVLLGLFLLAAAGAGYAWYARLLPPQLIEMLHLPDPNAVFGRGAEPTVPSADSQTDDEEHGLLAMTVDELRARLKGLIDSGASAEQLYEFGIALYGLNDRDRRDIGYRAIDAAAQRGHPKALFEIGRLYDPRDPLPGKRVGIEAPDPQLAAKYYKQAAGKGATEAEDALVGLCAYMGRPGADADPLVQAALTESCGG